MRLFVAAMGKTETANRWGLFPFLLHFVLVCGIQTAYTRAYVHSPSLRSGVIIPVLFRLATWTLPAFQVLWLSRTNHPFRANRLQALLFVLIHVPGWAFLGQLQFPDILHPLGYTPGLGLLLGFVLKKNNSLWACMVVHSCSNFASFAIAAA